MSNKKESLDQTVTFSSDVQCNWLYTFRTVSGATIQDQVIAATEYLNSDHKQTSSPETVTMPLWKLAVSQQEMGYGLEITEARTGNGYLVLL